MLDGGRLLYGMLLVREPEQSPCSKRSAPMSILRQSPEFAKSAEAISLSTLTEIIPPEVVTQAIERSGTRGKRRRKLPAELMAVAIVVLGLFAGATLRYAVLKTLQGLRLRADCTTDQPAGKGAICKARYRYGPCLLRELFGLVCQPLASPDTPGAYLFGLRLMALDGTIGGRRHPRQRSRFRSPQWSPRPLGLPPDQVHLPRRVWHPRRGRYGHPPLEYRSPPCAMSVSAM